MIHWKRDVLLLLENNDFQNALGIVEQTKYLIRLCSQGVDGSLGRKGYHASVELMKLEKCERQP